MDLSLHPRCVATTEKASGESARSGIISSSHGNGSDQSGGSKASSFREARFTADGTTLVTHNEDQSIKTFVLPVDLLEESNSPRKLISHSSRPSPTPIRSYALYPHFNLQDASTTVFLASSKDQPILLNNALYSETVQATYPWIHSTTEEYLSPHSLAWTGDGTRFVAGGENRIAVFDSSYNGSGPITTHKTASGRNERKLFGAKMLSCRGIMSAMSISPEGMLAVGSTQRQIALYDNEGSGECATAFSLASPTSKSDPLYGTGITQLAWSPCSAYLLVAERQSDVVQVYDMRNTLSRVGWLSGRRADTTQRLGMSVVPTADGYEVWAGGTDGCVRMWRNPGSMEGEQEPDEVARVCDGMEPVTSAAWHPRGAVLATCSGNRSNPSPVRRNAGSSSSSTSEEESDEIAAGGLNIWTS